MQRWQKGLALSTLCLTLSAASCGEKRVVTSIPIPAERIDCVALSPSARPQLPPEHKIDWVRLRTLAEAKAEHDLFVKSVRAREAIVAHYIVTVEGVLFACANDAEWLRDREKELHR